MKKIKDLSKAKKIGFFAFLVLSILTVIFIFSNSMKNGEASSADSEWLSELVVKVINSVFKTSITPEDVAAPIRTFAHFAEFALLAFCLSGTFYNLLEKAKKYFPAVFITTVVVSLIDETIQLFSEGRAFQLFDIFIDSSGGIFGFLFFLLIISIFTRNKKAKNG